LAGLQLVEQGKITMDTVVSDILPELANPVIVDDPFANKMTYKPAQTTITFWHLLNHSSGLFYDVKRNPSHALPSAYTDPHVGENLIKEWYNKIKKDLPGMPLKFEPGTDFAYGYNVDSIGFIVERLTGKTLEQYCRENIFLPLGMTNTSFFMTPEMKERSVSLSFRNSDGIFLKFPTCSLLGYSQCIFKVRMHLGGVGLESTLKDYLSLLRHLLQIHGATAVSPILSAETVKSLFLPTLTEKGVQSVNAFTKMTDGQWSTALCLNTTDWPGRRRKFSGWWFGWAGTFHFIDPTTGIGAVFGTQVIPTRDADVWSLWSKLEAALYSAIEH
ncbi:beta-lactamase/transpeptidase-like protein, partial [Cyathus striatus]